MSRPRQRRQPPETTLAWQRDSIPVAVIFHIPISSQGSLAITPRPRGGDWLEDDIAGLARSGVGVLFTPRRRITSAFATRRSVGRLRIQSAHRVTEPFRPMKGATVAGRHPALVFLLVLVAPAATPAQQETDFPRTTLHSGDARLTGTMLSSSWLSASGLRRIGTSGGFFMRLEGPTELIVQQGQPLEVRFSRTDAPVAVSAGAWPRPAPVSSDPRPSTPYVSLPNENPTTIRVTLESGAYWLCVRSSWSPGNVEECFPVKVR